jgi:putative addiction module component (TIGR02574 family)
MWRIKDILKGSELHLAYLGGSMNEDLKRLAMLALALPHQERLQLIDLLLDSVDSTDSWEDEIAARLAAFENGEVEPVAAEEVFAKARSLIG